jgi:hypothetical protein
MKAFNTGLCVLLLSALSLAQNVKISQLPAGAPAQPTDVLPAARSGANVSLKVSDIQAGLLPLTGGTLTGPLTGSTFTATQFCFVAGGCLSSWPSGGGMVWPLGNGIPIVVAGNAWGTTLTPPTGAIVGTTDTQTLTNKTVDGVTPATLGYLDATSSVQTQLNSKAATAVTCVPGSFVAQTDGTTVTWAIANQPCANASLVFTADGGSRTLNLTGLVNGGSYVLTIQQDASGTGEGLILGSGCVWKVSGNGGGAITPSTGANAIDVLSFTYDGANCYLNFARNFD